MEIQEKIRELVEKHISGASLFIVDINTGGGPGMIKLSIFLDGDNGVSIDECALISRKVSAEIEEKELIKTPWIIEVSSPGTDQPLKLKRQYFKNTGKKVRVMLNDGRTYSGRLEKADENGILINAEIISKQNKKKTETVPVEIPYTEIKKTNIIVSFK